MEVERTMTPKLEALKGTGGSIRVGTTGTIGSLMTKELESKSAPQTSIPPSGVVNTPKKLQPRNEASSSSETGNDNYGQSNSTQKTRRKSWKGTHHMPILTSDNGSVENTPIRKKADKKGLNLVEVVDIGCGNPNKWSSPIANRFKKLNSPKLSQTIA